MLNESVNFQPVPLIVRIGSEEIEVASLDCAINLIRSLRHDRLGRFAEMLLTQMEAAKAPQQRRDAWIAFETWSLACGLQPHHGDLEHAA
ncbi:hypothetical protein FHS55_003659 [Angulomicrobium tetraedrale]|uniref:Uncharacterized protein n=1 Tax=Ancylobacter tetraedralis TaxID=217068 RepID=A0A839ZE57_9HYPH|nr:hypothetical protein [Ancylobacter tetraedralis]MBB3773034.1 hypothetical protein [Ancylobacter tetraedralis]